MHKGVEIVKHPLMAPVDCWYVYAHNDDVGSRNMKFSTPANVGKAK